MCHKADALQRALNSRKAKMGTKKNWPLWLLTYEGAINKKDWLWCVDLPQEYYVLFLKSVSFRLWYKHANAIQILKNQQDYIRPSRGFGTHMTRRPNTKSFDFYSAKKWDNNKGKLRGGTRVVKYPDFLLPGSTGIKSLLPGSGSGYLVPVTCLWYETFCP